MRPSAPPAPVSAPVRYESSLAAARSRAVLGKARSMRSSLDHAACTLGSPGEHGLPAFTFPPLQAEVRNAARMVASAESDRERARSTGAAGCGPEGLAAGIGLSPRRGLGRETPRLPRR